MSDRSPSAGIGAPLQIDGELTVQSAAGYKAVLLSALDSDEVIDLDLSGVSELDTAGLQLLLLMKREAGQLGKDVRLIDPSAAVREVLALARLDERLEAVPAPRLPQELFTSVNRGAR